MSLFLLVWYDEHSLRGREASREMLTVGPGGLLCGDGSMGLPCVAVQEVNAIALKSTTPITLKVNFLFSLLVFKIVKST